jgi:3-methyladenine DNA glycosylase AlkD
MDKTSKDVISSLAALADPKRAVLLGRYFKTGPGDYGEGDIFIGLTVPQVRTIAKEYRGLPLPEISTLLESPIHEHRLTALIILTYAFSKADEAGRTSLYDFYLAHTKGINNWDLVDLSSHEIVGEYLAEKKDRSALRRLIASKNIWERRIGVIATFAFIRRSDLTDVYELAMHLLQDKHDLMHKAVGWMLREAGKKDKTSELAFLDTHYRTMPRTMLRYAIEKFTPAERAHYLAK